MKIVLRYWIHNYTEDFQTRSTYEVSSILGSDNINYSTSDINYSILIEYVPMAEVVKETIISGINDINYNNLVVDVFNHQFEDKI